MRLSSRLAAANIGARAKVLRGIVPGALVAAVLGISACTTNNVLSLRPDVDIGTHTAALPASGGMQELVPDDPYLQQAEMEQPAVAEPVNAGDPAAMEQQAMLAPAVESGMPIDAGQPADMEPAVDLSQPQPSEMIEPAEPVEPQAAPAPLLAAYPRMEEPAISGPPPMPAEEASCRRELKRLGVTFREMSPINEGGSCRIDHPIKVSTLSRNIGLQPAATLNCEMALTFAKWTKNELNPAARRRYWSSVKTIHQMSSYSCRRINGSHTMSEHSKGNAIDVGRIELSSGRDIDVEKPGIFSFRTKGFLNTVRSDGCDYFSTVLGPGYNYDHRNHFHFDIKPRRRTSCH